MRNFRGFPSRRWEWLAIPNVGMLFVTLQAMGFLMVFANPAWHERLALVPERVFGGELWRVITFLSLPVSMQPLWLILALWFSYFILSSLEATWGALRTTLYVLTGWAFSVAASLVLGLPITSASDLTATFFLAAAALFPDFEILLFFIVPVKMKWLGLLSGVFLALRLLGADWAGRAYLVAAYLNFLLFFGPQVVNRVRNRVRRRTFRRALKQ